MSVSHNWTNFQCFNINSQFQGRTLEVSFKKSRAAKKMKSFNRSKMFPIAINTGSQQIPLTKNPMSCLVGVTFVVLLTKQQIKRKII